MIALFTDFGLTGPYTGQVKAVLARLAPGLPVIDLLADAPAFRPQLAAYLLPAYLTPFCPGDVVLAVIDPGVGGARRALAIEADGLWLTGPDNGLFELVLRRARSWRAWAVTWRPDALSASFHGRDLFAPVAARLALGEPPPGHPVQPLRLPEWPDDLRAVVYVDPYGNAITGLQASVLAGDAELEVAGQRVRRVRTFSDVAPGEPLWYENANGLAEIALNGGSAAQHFGLAPGNPVVVVPPVLPQRPPGMSSYENYDLAAARYDQTRWPIGLEIILGCLAQALRPLHEQTVLDAGCGTGNYARALLRHVARIEAVDLSEGMLALARDKLAQGLEGGRVRLQRGSIAELPLADAAVDGAMVNQVLHHLPDEPEAGWPMHRRVIGEIARVLTPGGVLVVNSCSEDQLARGFWAASFAPRASELMARRIMPLDLLEDTMAAAGIEPRGRFVPVDALVQGSGYLDPRGPRRAEWRAGDSLWALADPDELAAVETALRSLDEAGELEARVAELDAPRRSIGQITLLYGIKS